MYQTKENKILISKRKNFKPEGFKVPQTTTITMMRKHFIHFECILEFDIPYNNIHYYYNNTHGNVNGMVAGTRDGVHHIYCNKFIQAYLVGIHWENDTKVSI